MSWLNKLVEKQEGALIRGTPKKFGIVPYDDKQWEWMKEFIKNSTHRKRMLVDLDDQLTGVKWQFNTLYGRDMNEHEAARLEEAQNLILAALGMLR